MASEKNTTDGLSTISEIKTGAYIWVVVVFFISGTMAYNLARYDRYLYDTKNKFIDPVEHRENRLSSTMLPHTIHDPRQDQEFTTAVERLSK